MEKGPFIDKKQCDRLQNAATLERSKNHRIRSVLQPRVQDDWKHPPMTCFFLASRQTALSIRIGKGR
jgi:hypothetical protein